MSGRFEVDCAALQRVAAAADSIADQAGEVPPRFRSAVQDTIAAVPGSQTAAAAQAMATVWTGRLDRGVEDLRELAHRLRLAADNYCAADARARDRTGGAGPPAGSPPPVREPIPGAPGGGHLGPHTQYDPGG